MLLLVTIGLVVVGAISLVIGFVSNSLGPIYISIACSVIAGVVLVVFSRMARRKEGAPAAVAAGAAPSPGSWAPASPPPPAPSPPPVTRVEPAPAPPAPPRRSEPVRSTATPESPTTTFTAPRGADVDDLDFPIPDYDNLRASQILDQLGDLSLDELDMVREREEQGKNRSTIIRRVDLRIDALEAEEDADVAPVASERPAPEPFPALGDDELEPAGADDFPIANYDQLSAAEIISMLDDLDDDELDMVAEREEQGRNRLEILDYIDEMFEEVGPDGQPVSAAAPPARSPVAAPPARKAAGKKAPARKAAAKQAPVKKIATPAAAATKATKATKAAKRAPARPAAAKAAPAPAQKSAGAAKKAAAGASPGTKSAARPSAGPAKATAGRTTVKRAKAAAKKVPPAKKR